MADDPLQQDDGKMFEDSDELLDDADDGSVNVIT